MSVHTTAHPTEQSPAALPARRVWTLVLASLGVFLTSLDVVVVVATALPALRTDLGAANGSYGTPRSFIAGFQPAIAVAGAVAAVGLIAAVLSPSRLATQELS
jgi:hypothetical protein